ncbi:MAG TPA: hypothetical protein VM580_21210 [Labilithrix sp.]|nr:hypothetical protein [Labilithrix sp.]
MIDIATRFEVIDIATRFGIIDIARLYAAASEGHRSNHRTHEPQF